MAISTAGSHRAPTSNWGIPANICALGAALCSGGRRGFPNVVGRVSGSVAEFGAAAIRARLLALGSEESDRGGSPKIMALKINDYCGRPISRIASNTLVFAVPVLRLCAKYGTGLGFEPQPQDIRRCIPKKKQCFEAIPVLEICLS